MTEMARELRLARIQNWVWTLRFYGLVYALTAIIFFFFPNELLYLINTLPRIFRLAETLPNPTDHFWTVLATGLMGSRCALCFFASEAKQGRSYVAILLVSNAIVIAGFISMFIDDHRYFAYLIGSTLELVAFFSMLWNLIRVGKLRHEPK